MPRNDLFNLVVGVVRHKGLSRGTAVKGEGFPQGDQVPDKVATFDEGDADASPFDEDI